MKFVTASLVFAASLGAAACVSTTSTMLGPVTASASPVAPANVTIYRTSEQVKVPYKEIALLNSRGDSNYTDEKAMFESMRKEASKIGANGVILDAVNEPGSGAKVAAAIFGVSAQRRGKAVAIRTEDPQQ